MAAWGSWIPIAYCAAVVGRAAKYLSEEGMEVLSLFLCSMDACGIPIAAPKLRDVMCQVKTSMTGVQATLPSKPTATKVLKAAKLSRKPMRDSPGGGLRASKTTEEYLLPYFHLLSDIVREYRIEPSLL